MNTCNNCRYFNKLDSSETIFSFNFCKKNHACFPKNPACKDFEEEDNWSHLNFLYLGLLNSSEIGLVEVPTSIKIGDKKINTNYRRVEMTTMDWQLCDKTKKENKNGDRLINSIEILFNKSTTNWGFMTHFGVFDSLKEGKLLVVGNLIKNGCVNKNIQVRFDIGHLEIELASFVEHNCNG